MWTLLLILSLLRVLQALPSYQQRLSDESNGDFCSTYPASEEYANPEPIGIQKVAIIGSGIVGASAAFTLQDNARENSGAPLLSITIFDQNPIPGGRITTTQIFDQPELTIDTCAATFNMISDTCVLALARDLGLTPTPVTGFNNGTAIWNGQEIVGLVEDNGFRDLQSSASFKQARFRRRYGDTPFNAGRNTIELSYSLAGVGNFRSLSQLFETSRLNESLVRGACERTGGLCRGGPNDDIYLREVIEASVRERFFGDYDELNELNSVLGLSSQRSLSSVRGGNLRLIDRLIKVSGARLALSTKVMSLENNAGKWNLFYSQAGQRGVIEQFDKVIIAAPISLANIAISPNPPVLPQVDFVDTVVTHFTSRRGLNPVFFGTGLPVPQIILTSATATKAGNKASLPFFSLRLLDAAVQPVNSTANDPMQNLYKIISHQNIPDTEILRYLEADDVNNRDTPAITWINREYLPKSVPRLDRALKLQDDIEIRPGLFYAGGGAQVVETIEFGCRMGRNAARLIVPQPVRQREPGNG